MLLINVDINDINNEINNDISMTNMNIYYK